jgi:hypothetical protein
MYPLFLDRKRLARSWRSVRRVYVLLSLSGMWLWDGGNWQLWGVRSVGLTLACVQT